MRRYIGILGSVENITSVSDFFVDVWVYSSRGQAVRLTLETKVELSHSK